MRREKTTLARQNSSQQQNEAKKNKIKDLADTRGSSPTQTLNPETLPRLHQTRDNERAPTQQQRSVK